MEMLVLASFSVYYNLRIIECILYVKHHSQTTERFKIIFNSKHSIHKVKNVLLLLLHILFVQNYIQDVMM